VTIDDIASQDDINISSVQLVKPDGLDGTLSEDGKTLTVPGEGVWTLDDNGDVTFVPEDGFNGNPTPIDYTAKDNYGNDTVNDGTLSIKYGPVAVNNREDNVTFADFAAGITQDILANDRATDGSRLDPSSVQLIAPSNGTLSADGKTVTVPGEGVWVVDNEGKLTFTPEDGFMRNPTPIRYTVKDVDGLLSNEAEVAITLMNGTKISGTYWIDANKNAKKDTNEEPIAGATVSLVDESGNVVATTITDANGQYKFDNVIPGKYTVKFTIPEDVKNDGYETESIVETVAVDASGNDPEGYIADSYAKCSACDNANGASALGWIAGFVMLLMISTVLYMFRREEA